VINLHNADFAAGLVTFDMDKNKFCDLTSDEFVKIHTGVRGNKRSPPKDEGYNYPVPSPEFNIEDSLINEGDFRGDFESSSFASASNGTHSSFQSSSISSQPSGFKSALPQPSGFKSPSAPSAVPSDFKLPSFLQDLLSGSKSSSSSSSSSSSLPVSPSSSKSSSLPVSPSSSNREKDMTNVFMGSDALAGQSEDEVDWRKKGAITKVKNQGNDHN
jgi:hypothetical protein